jgi:glycosyltransferase involved in cell wall biosynthesis
MAEYRPALLADAIRCSKCPADTRAALSATPCLENCILISVLILTKNEEQDLPRCLDSVAWCEDVHVFDSFSDDRTVEIARHRGAHVLQRQFDGYASQRNAALNSAPFRFKWILVVDADERIPPSLKEEMLAFVKIAPADISAGRMRRRDFLDDTWLKHCQASPYYIRLLRAGQVQYHREVNEVLRVDGKIHDFRSSFDHYPFSKGVRHWLNKHNVYSTMEAQCVLASRAGDTSFSLGKALFAADFNERRFHQKEIFYRLPARPLLKFALLYLFKRGFLDGRAGLNYAMLQAIYEYFIVLKTRELENQRRLNVATSETSIATTKN